MNNQQLLAIRQQILSSALPLLLESKGAPEDRFDLILRFLRYANGAGVSDLYQKAYETAMMFENAEEKLEALMQLLSEVDAEIDSMATPDDEQTPEQQEQIAQPVASVHP